MKNDPALYVESVDRDSFLDYLWRHEPGEHITLIGPTGSGKTTLAYQLLDVSTSPKHPGVVMVMKPRDPVAAKWNKELDYRRVRRWPPPAAHLLLSRGNPRGWTLWPKHTFDLDRDNALLTDQMGRALQHSYKSGNRIIFADELYSLSNELNLEKPLVALWSRGRSMGTSLMGATQKPTHVPLWAYSQASHLFLHNDPDKRSRERFAEIGGVDTDLVRAVVHGMPKHHWLYIKRDGPEMCIVEP